MRLHTCALVVWRAALWTLGLLADIGIALGLASLAIAAVAALFVLLGCEPAPKASSPHRAPLGTDAVSGPLGSADARFDGIIDTVPDNRPVVKLATDGKADLSHAATGLDELRVEWAARANDYEVQLALLRKAVDEASGESDRQYRNWMRGLQFLFLAASVGGLIVLLVVPGTLAKTIGGGVATACGVGFVGILVSVQIEKFMDRYGLWIAAVAVSVALAMLLYLLWRYVSSNRQLVKSGAVLIAKAGGLDPGTALALDAIQDRGTKRLVNLFDPLKGGTR